MGRGAGEIGMAEHIAGAVDAGPLAVPDSENAVVAGALEHVELLRTPKRRRRQVFIDGGMEFDVVLGEDRLGAAEFAVDGAQG